MSTDQPNSSDMMLAVIGAGKVGRALAQRFIHRGGRVRFGVPEPAKYKELVEALGDSATVSDVKAAIEGCDVVILALPFGAATQVADAIRDWEGRVLIDATNPIAAGGTGLSIGTTDSGAEMIQRHAVNANVVKAFNTTGFENMLDPRYPTGPLFMPIAGNDVVARGRAIALATLLGFDAVDMGTLAAARYLEPLAMVWIHLAMRMGHGRRFGFVRALAEARR